jgi:predicted Zn-dependent protease
VARLSETGEGSFLSNVSGQMQRLNHGHSDMGISPCDGICDAFSGMMSLRAARLCQACCLKSKMVIPVKRIISIGWCTFVVLFLTGLAGTSLGWADHESAKQSYLTANALFDQGRFAEAVAAYDKAIGGDPKYVEAYYNRALASEMVDRAQALKNWLRFIDAAGDLPAYKWDVARIRARIQILTNKPSLPEVMHPGHYVAAAGDYYREVGVSSEGEQWPDLPVKVFLGSAPNIKWQQGAREAFDTWSAVFPMQLVILPDKADIRMGWEASSLEEGHVGEKREWVRFKRIGDQLTARRVATITVDLSRNWSKDEMRAIVSHELGHAIGINDHSDSRKDIMYWQMQDKTHQIRAPYFPIPVFWRSLVSQPSQRDINTLIRLYNSPGSIARFD